jgi:hypothetical protein
MQLHLPETIDACGPRVERAADNDLTFWGPNPDNSTTSRLVDSGYGQEKLRMPYRSTEREGSLS